MSERSVTDQMIRLSLGSGAVRAQLVSLSSAWREVVSRHELPDAVIQHLGHLCAAGVLLAAALKFEGKLILQIHGDGPLRLVVVESDAGGSFRATAKLSECAVISSDAGLRELVNCAGQGRFVVTLDPGGDKVNRQAYQGIVQLEGDGVAAVLESYMSRSEQVPTRIWLAANREVACGLMLQRLPEDGGVGAPTDPQAWERLCILADTVTSAELLSLTPEQLLRRLFWQETASNIDDRTCRFVCSCTREKVATMLRMLGTDEVMDIVAERGDVEVNCDFCNQRYGFDAVDCAQLFAVGSSTAPVSGARH